MCSVYKHPVGAEPNNTRFRVKLGEKRICPHQNAGDPIITGVEKIGGNAYRIFIDFTRLPIVNYRQLFVHGQKAPNDAWMDYPVTDNYPCFYTDVVWPSGSEPFEFSFGVVKDDGLTE